MKQKRWIVIVWLVVAVAILVTSVVFEWQRGINLPEGAQFSSFAHEHWANTSNLVSNLSGLLSFFLISLVFYFLLPRMVRSMGQASARKGEVLRTALLGLLAALLIIVTLFSAALSNGAFPFAIVTILAVLIASLIGMVALELRFGAWLASLAGWENASAIVHLLLAVLALYPLTLLPAVGSLIMAVYLLLGLGTVVLSRVNALYPWTHDLSNLKE